MSGKLTVSGPEGVFEEQSLCRDSTQQEAAGALQADQRRRGSEMRNITLMPSRQLQIAERARP